MVYVWGKELAAAACSLQWQAWLKCKVWEESKTAGVEEGGMEKKESSEYLYAAQVPLTSQLARVVAAWSQRACA